MAQFLLDAAADARRLGQTHALTPDLLQALTLALWREDRGPTQPSGRWFDEALAYTIQPLRADDGVRALIPVDIPDDEGDTPGFDLADYLQQHLTRRTRPTTDQTWQALILRTHRPDDLTRIASAASTRGQHSHAEHARRTAAATRDPDALRELAAWLDRQRRTGRCWSGRTVGCSPRTTTRCWPTATSPPTPSRSWPGGPQVS